MTPEYARKVLPIYRKNLERYLRTNDPRTAVQKALIARLEKDAEE